MIKGYLVTFHKIKKKNRLNVTKEPISFTPHLVLGAESGLTIKIF